MNESEAAAHRVRTPWWVWLVIAVLSAIEPLTHAWIRYAPPEGTAPTGLHAVDSAFYLDSMQMFSSGFSTPYATCQAERGPSDIRYFSTTIYWMYGVVGAAADTIGANRFIGLGVANGFGAFVYLLAIYRFLLAVVPSVANLAFAFFALGGGPAGLVYILSSIVGWTSSPAFEDYFLRFALYELFEGPYFVTILHFPRLYYTLPLALCFLGFTAFVHALHMHCTRHLAFSTFVFFAGTLINMRFGVFLWFVVVLYVLNRDFPNRWRYFWVFTAGCALGALISAWVISTHPTFSQNTFATNQTAAWFSAVLAAGLFFWPLAARPLWNAMKEMETPFRVAAFAAAGYLIAYAALFLGYQAYYGNLLVARDGAAAVWVSDRALIGAVLGVVWGLTRKSSGDSGAKDSWIALWILIFLSIAVSAFLGGWFLKLNPQRLTILLTLPLAVVAAKAVYAYRERRPLWAYGFSTAILVGGVCSAAVSVLFFQGPLVNAVTGGPYVEKHVETMSEADAELLGDLPPGVYLAPPPYGDIVALRDGVQTVYGVASVHADPVVADLEPAYTRFFGGDATDEERSAFLDAWCVEYVYLGDTWKADNDIVAALRALPELTVIRDSGGASLLRVTR